MVVYVLELARRLAALGYDIDIWTRRFENQEEIEIGEPHERLLNIARESGEDFNLEGILRQKVVTALPTKARRSRQGRRL